jgi:hypothetical protein
VVQQVTGTGATQGNLGLRDHVERVRQVVDLLHAHARILAVLLREGDVVQRVHQLHELETAVEGFLHLSHLDGGVALLAQLHVAPAHERLALHGHPGRFLISHLEEFNEIRDEK